MLHIDKCRCRSPADKGLNNPTMQNVNKVMQESIRKEIAHACQGCLSINQNVKWWLFSLRQSKQI